MNDATGDTVGSTGSVPDVGTLVGHRFPGGRYTIAHWENWLLTDCTGAAQLGDGLVHPVALFHVPILGSGTSIREIFALLGVEGAGSVSLLGYDWEYFVPLREDVEYRCEGGIVAADRHIGDDGRVADEIAFSVDLVDDADVLVARITNRWKCNRGHA
jgi:hypothetical protein